MKSYAHMLQFLGVREAFCADVALAALAHYVHNLSVAKDGGPGVLEPSMR
jgi:hypothetical protein